MVMFHVAPLPLALVLIVAAHVLLVRKHGVVPPMDAIDHDAEAPAATDTENTGVAS
jgi:ubiquinol-cytochrome c reductase cytochrome b subunit